MRWIFISLVGVFTLFSLTSKVEARGYSSYGSYKTPSYYSAPRYNLNPRYIVPRSQIYVPQTQPVAPYFKSNGSFVQGYQRAPYGSLNTWHNPTYHRFNF